jgi:hypothetical protein
MGRFNLKKLNKGKVIQQYQVAIINKFAALESLQDNEDNNRAWDYIRQNVKISVQESLGYCESNNYIPWFG